MDKKSFVLIQMQKKIALVLMKEIFSYYPADCTKMGYLDKVVYGSLKDTEADGRMYSKIMVVFSSSVD